ncbi:LysM peptidoglycan-binding domain-containing protein [Sphingobacterium paludis]|uniref:Membrane-bound lytic murein transglycosylase D n=1 Tax=Sphingobacterium paludis TaxID=1476465 RepID=A0A4R7CSR1_9SPHI|nr:LysM peptidoglycan-binding domain-containing protein [Sphingobacterium paludis]TDS11051.1 membrane-bound lytic murein transglycosylase D [Sphingobacterium paludis]
MKKIHLWVLPFCALSITQSAIAQDMAHMETEEHTLHLQELVSNQRDAIFSGIDSLKKLSYVDPIHNAEDSLIFQRMRKIQKTVPLAYNEKIKSYIDKYVSRNYNPYMCKLQGLAQHYFPIYEEIFQGTGIPDEIKYISVVESSLDPHLVSRSGAVGLWQFMYATAKGYDLTMDSYIDERKDPYAACHAAGRYFKEAYDEFNDWLLALASYNCGRGAVRRAIERSGLDHPDFWQLSPYLPEETQNYIPKFIAMTYTLKHAQEYGIENADTDFVFAAKPIMVENNVDLARVATAINLPLETLKKFNPSFKRTIIVASGDKPKRLILPQTSSSNDSLLYAALSNTPFPGSPREQAMIIASSPSRPAKYTAKQGESVASVARKFGVAVQDLRAWNGLSLNSRIAGRTLLLEKEENIRLAKARSTTVGKSASATAYVTYTVRKGDTLSHIANKHKGSTIAQIKADNNLRGSTLSIGQKIKIKK